MPVTKGHRNTALNAGLWVLADQGGQQVIHFCFSVVLARLLTPAEFGLIAILAIFRVVAQKLIEGGFGNALINNRESTREDESAVFIYNMGMAILIFGIQWIAAPYLADFYNEPLIKGIARWMGLSYIFSSLQVVQSALLRKQMRFRPLAAAGVISLLVSGSVGITCAFMGLGVWSLVAQGLTLGLVRVMVLWVLHAWRPVWPGALRRFKTMGKYGIYVVMGTSADQMFRYLYPAIIGRIFEKRVAGLFARADTTVLLPVNVIHSMIRSVAFPLFSSLREDPSMFYRGYRKVILLETFISVPIVLLLGVLGRPLFLLLFGSQWLPAVPMFQGLCLAAMVQSTNLMNLNGILASGRADLYFRIILIKVLVGIALVTVGVRFGVMGLVASQIVLSWAALLVTMRWSRRLLAYRFALQLKELSIYWIFAVLGGAVAWVVIAHMNDMAPIWQLMAGGISGGLVYLAGCGFLRSAGYIEAVRIAKELLGNLRARDGLSV